MSALDTRFVHVSLSAPKNPTSDAVEFAFKTGGAHPTTADWQTGTWQANTSPYVAEILVGPANGGLVLEEGSYTVWLKITDYPEVPVIPCGLLTIE